MFDTKQRRQVARKAAPPKISGPWKVVLYPSTVSGGHYAHLFDASNVCRSWRDCFSKRGALHSLRAFAAINPVLATLDETSGLRREGVTA